MTEELLTVLLRNGTSIYQEASMAASNVTGGGGGGGGGYHGFFKYHWWQYFIIPWIAGLVGYLTNVLALEMTFYPIEFWGIEIFRLKNEPWGLFGWQGIIPTKGAYSHCLLVP